MVIFRKKTLRPGTKRYVSLQNRTCFLRDRMADFAGQSRASGAPVMSIFAGTGTGNVKEMFSSSRKIWRIHEKKHG